MSKNGLAVAPGGTTLAPEELYVEMEQDEDVARGHVRVKEIIVYDFDRMEKIIDDFTGEPTGKERVVEKGRKPYFCQTKEQELIFKENNPDVRTESFSIQLLKSTAIKKLNDPRNVKQFTSPEQHQPMEDLTEEPGWRQQASKLGIKMYQRKKEDVLMDIVTALSKENDNG